MVQAVSLHVSRGLGGDDLTVCGTVESLPGPTQRKPYPDAFYATGASLHEKWRISSCAWCLEVISRAIWRKALNKRCLYLPDNPSALEGLQHHLPGYSCDILWMPLSLHITCLRFVCHGRRCHTSGEAALQRLNGSISAKVAARHCSGDRCDICISFNDIRSVIEERFEKPTPPQFVELAPPTRRKRTVVFVQGPSPKLSSNDLMAMNSGTTSSARATGLGADILRERKSVGDTAVDSVGGAVFRRDDSISNSVFGSFFSDVDCPFGSTDGGAVVCNDLLWFVSAICWLRGHQVYDIRLFKVNCDGGRGSLKLMMQLLYKDDPIFTGADAASRRRGALRNYGGLLDSGVRRTYILGLIEGAKEHFASVRFLLDRFDFVALRKAMSPASRIVAPNDAKMQAFWTGIMQAGCRYPMSTSHFSPFAGHSRPDEVRTAASVVASLERRRSAEEAKGSALDPIDFDSVVCCPVKLLTLRPAAPLAEILVPAQLHILLGIVKELLYWGNLLDADVVAAFLRRIKVVRNVKHGEKDFQGNESRKILRRFEEMRLFLKPRNSAAGTTSPQSDSFRSFLLHLLVDLAGRFSAVVSATMGAVLSRDWAQAIDLLAAAMTSFVKHFNKRHPVLRHRNPDRITMKIQCLLTEVPQEIQRHGMSLIAVSEQSFESLHAVYALHAAKYKIPNTSTQEIEPLRKSKRRRLSSRKGASAVSRLADRSRGILNPSDGTRSGGSRHKRRLAEAVVDGAQADTSLTPTTEIIGPSKNARAKRLHAVIAFNRASLPYASAVQTRVRKLLDWRCACLRDTDEYSPVCRPSQTCDYCFSTAKVLNFFSQKIIFVKKKNLKMSKKIDF